MTDRKHVLVVEDEWLLASEISRRLTKSGYDVIGPVPTVEEAMERIEHRQPNCAVLDVQLDGGTTLALVPRLVEKHIPFFFLSGHSTRDFPELVAHTVLSKPADWNDFFRTLETKLLQKA